MKGNATRQLVTNRRVEVALALLMDVLDEYNLYGQERDNISLVRFYLSQITEGEIKRYDD